MNINKHGLKRSDLKPAQKTVIRQNSKFGCVICRCAIYTYEHIDPPFTEAKSHDPEKMCLLCPIHQQMSTGGSLSKQRIQSEYEKIKNASYEDIKRPSNQGFFDLYGRTFNIKIGPTTFTNINSIINIDGENYLSLKPNPEDPNTFVINGKFQDEKGQELFEIVDNEWIGNHNIWDIDIVGSSLRIRRKKGKILFAMNKDLETNSIEITHLNMWAISFHIKVENHQLFVGQYEQDKYAYYGIDGDFLYGKCGLFLNSKKTPFLAVGNWYAKGGETHIEGTGIYIGRGAGKAYLRQISVHASENCPRFVEYIFCRAERQLFVSGILEVKNIDYPDWQETIYLLNGLELDSRPNSWGKIGENEQGQSIEVFHISGSEPSIFEHTEHFLGYWANDLLNQSWSDNIFECEVEAYDDEGNKYIKRVKRSEMKNNKVVNELNYETKQWFHPHQFAGVSVWKK